jgi:hypothetical protein
MTGRHRGLGLWVLSIAVFAATLGVMVGPLPTAWAVTTPLTNGVPVNSTAQQNFFTDFSIVVPPGATQLTVTLTNLSGDVDLFVKFNQLPETNDFTCTSQNLNTDNEICTISNPPAGTWFISAIGFDPGTNSFTVTATFQTGGGGGNPVPLTNGVPVNSTVQHLGIRDFSLEVPAGATNLTVTTTNATGDVDLYVRFGQLPNENQYDCRPFTESGNETCPDPNESGNIGLFANPQSGTWFITVFGFDPAPGTQSFTVTASFQTGGGGGGDVSDFVERLYQQVLGRQADPAGLQAFVQQIETFGTVIPTVLAFFKSQEFLNQNLNNVQFLTVLYRTFLNRDPDPAGLASFLALLQTGCRTRDTLIAALSFSDEFKSLIPPLQVADLRVPFLAEIFAWTLNRPPDPAGFQSFLNQLTRGTAPSTITQFLHSNEFTNPRKTPVEFVSSLYLVYLGRPPDCGGLASFVGALIPDTDAKRDQLAAQFAGSQEFQDKLNQVFPPPGSTVTITVSIADSLPGTVTSSPAGINCPGTCTGNFASGTTVILTATGTGGTTFGGWGGDCAAFGTALTCTLSNVTSAKSVTAAFNSGPPGGGISGVYSTIGTATSTSACGNPPVSIQVTPAFNLTITQTGSTFTGSGTANITSSNTPIQATINLTNGTVGANNQLSGSFTLTISALGQSIPVTGTFTGSVSGNTLTINATGTLPANLGAPPGCGFTIALTGHK